MACPLALGSYARGSLNTQTQSAYRVLLVTAQFFFSMGDLSDCKGDDYDTLNVIKMCVLCKHVSASAQRKLHRVGPNCETWPNSLTENPY